MAETNQTTQTAAAEPAPQSRQMESRLARQDPPIAKVPRQWAGLKLAHEALMLDDAQAVLAEDRRATRAHRDQMALSNAPPPAPASEGEMGIHVGDQIVHQAPVAAGGGLPRWAATALTVAGLLGGGGLGVGVASLLRPPALPAPQQPQQQPQQPPRDRELRVRWWMEDGQLKSIVEPIPIPK